MKKINSNHISNEFVNKFLSYLLVGGLATLVEWLFYWIFRNFLSVEYMCATVMAIVVSTFSNWLFGRIITFRNVPQKNVLAEILQVYTASAIGMLLNMLIMWVLHGRMKIWDMLSKIIATGLVFLYNYLIRVLVIYKDKK